MADDRLRKILAERYGNPDDLAAEQAAPPPPPAPRPIDPTDTPQQHRQVLLDALPHKAKAA